MPLRALSPPIAKIAERDERKGNRESVVIQRTSSRLARPELSSNGNDSRMMLYRCIDVSLLMCVFIEFDCKSNFSAVTADKVNNYEVVPRARFSQSKNKI